MKSQNFFFKLRIFLFVALLTVGCVVGFLTFLRPTVSESEGRTLTTFPSFSLKSFLSGDYTSQVSLWYSDSYPGRDSMLDANGELKSLYGIHTVSFEGGDVEADTIDPNEDFTMPEFTTRPEGENDTGFEEETSPVDGQVINGFYAEGKTGYELYYFNKDLTDRYIKTVTQVAVDLKGLATVYDMVVPAACCYGLSAEKTASLGASNGFEGIDYMYSRLEAYSRILQDEGMLTTPIVTLDVGDTLGAHYDNEYIFYRTDHHWTGLGAYYASRFFLDTVGRSYPSLDYYTEVEVGNFLGSLYRHTQSEVLKKYPDTTYAYKTPAVQTITIYTDGEYRTAPLIDENVTSSNKYLCFSGGDVAYYEMHNENITDGSKILIIKESYANAFMPMLVDSYEYVYAVDYRFWRGDLTSFVRENEIDTVLFLNYLVCTVDDYSIRCIEKLVQ